MYENPVHESNICLNNKKNLLGLKLDDLDNISLQKKFQKKLKKKSLKNLMKK